MRAGADRFQGYDLPGLAFESGDVLVVRRVERSSIGPPYTTIWHRDPGGRWTLTTSVEPARSCAHYIRPAVTDVRTDDVEVAWSGAYRLSVTARRMRLRLSVRLTRTPLTRAISIAAAMLPALVWRLPILSRLIGRAAGRALGAGPLALSGRSPSAHAFVQRLRGVWLVTGAAAVIDGRDLGALVPLAEPVSLGDFTIPRIGLVTIGAVEFATNRSGGVESGVTPRRRSPAEA
jgi:hypothetical protein